MPSRRHAHAANKGKGKGKISIELVQQYVSQLAAALPDAVDPAALGTGKQHVCIVAEVSKLCGMPVDCDITNAPPEVKARYSKGARYLLSRLHRWSDRGERWGLLPARANDLFRNQHRR